MPASLAASLAPLWAVACAGCIIPVQVGLESPVNQPPLILAGQPDFLGGDVLGAVAPGGAAAPLELRVWARDADEDDVLKAQLYVVDPPRLNANPLTPVPIGASAAGSDPLVRVFTWAPATYCSNNTFATRRTTLAVYVTDSEFGVNFGLPATSDAGIEAPRYDFKTWVIDCQ